MGSWSAHCELAWLGGAHADHNVVVHVTDDRITGVERGLRPADAVHLAGLTLPGLANAHSHAFHRALRGRTQAGRGSFWTWREQMYDVAERLDPESYHRLARAAYAEMALAGISAVGEFHYLHHGPDGTPYASPNEMGEALIAAAADAGIRITLLDACYLRGGAGIALQGVQRRFSDGDAGRWADRAGQLADGPGVRVGAAIHSARAVDPAGIAVVAAWAADRDAPLHAHVSEQPGENAQIQAAHGCSPTELLADHGAIDDRFTAVHATHVEATDIDLLGRAGCSCCLCPTTERDLADGIGPAARLRDAGARLTLGTDSHAVIDILEEARAVELHERLESGHRGHHDAPSLLRMATSDGHASLGWAEGGRIAPGALADLTTISLDSVRTVGAAAGHVLDAVVFAATAADVRHVVIGGRVVVRDGRHTSIDVVGELRSALA